MTTKNNKNAPVASENVSSIKNVMKNSTMPTIIHHRGDLNTVTFEGKKFKRQKEIFLPSFGMLITCAPYDDHFILYDPSKLGWTIFCTCGSPAVVAGYDAYKQDASPQGQLLVCYAHSQLTPGKHMPVNR